MARGIQTQFTDHLEGAKWGFSQKRVQDFWVDIMPRIQALKARKELFTFEQYGEVRYSQEGSDSVSRTYPLMAFKVGNWADEKKPTILIMGGMHPYEKGGIEGVMHFLEKYTERYARDFNMLVIPVVNPSAYDVDSRFNLLKQNPNRSFVENSPCAEANQLIGYLKKLDKKFLLAIDCHETLPEDVEVAKMDGSRVGLDMNMLPDATYIMEDCKDPRHSIGRELVRSVEKVVPIFRGPNVLGFPNNNGVVRGLALGVPGAPPGTPAAHGIPETSAGYLIRNGFTGHTITTETWAPPEMDMKTRINAQLQVIIGGLQALVSRQKSGFQR